MPTSDPLEILLAHDRWGTHQLLDACEKLTAEQFHQRFEMGLGSLHDTVSHMVGAMRGWSDLLAGRDRPRLEGTRRTVAELRVLHNETADELTASAHAHPVGEQVSREREGKSYTFTRGGVLTHIATHAMHHRAQCLNMLRHLGLTPLPKSSVLEWMLMADSK